MEHKLRRTDRRLACQGAVLEFYRDSMILPDGAEQTWDYVHHKKGGGACSVPVLPDGSILLVVADVGNENYHAVYHLTDSENEQLLDNYTEYEIIDDDTVLYRVYPNRYGSISYDEAEGKVKKSEITLEEGAEVFERNETTVYYYVSGYRTLDFYRAEYDGTVTGLGKLDCGEYDHNNSKFEINSNGELFIALRKKEILDWFGHYKDYYTIYRTDGGSVKEVVEKATHPRFSNGFCMYNKLDDEEEKLFCITGNENETELQGFNGELYFMRETEDGSTILFELDETTYYAKRDNLTLTDAKQTDGDVSKFYFVGNVPYFEQNGNLYCIKDGELSLAVEDVRPVDIVNNLPRSMTTDDIFDFVKNAY